MVTPDLCEHHPLHHPVGAQLHHSQEAVGGKNPHAMRNGSESNHFFLSKGFVSVRRTSHKSLRKREVRMARVSLAIVFLFLICHSPKIVPTVCEIVYSDAKVSLM